LRVTSRGLGDVYKRQRQAVTTSNVEFHCTTFENFTPDRRYHSIIMSRILEHIEQPVSLLQRISEWLAPGGRLYIIVPNAHSLNRRIGKAMGMIQRLEELTERDQRVGHFRVYHRESLAADIVSAGMKPAHWDGIFLKPLSDAQVQDWPPNLLDAFYVVGRDLPDWCTEIYVECCRPGEES
jgi:2-polyprenyl-3-methyl-5-hydroxy-6-metoxy-1,4-benzoquinol methylase